MSTGPSIKIIGGLSRNEQACWPWAGRTAHGLSFLPDHARLQAGLSIHSPGMPTWFLSEEVPYGMAQGQAVGPARPLGCSSFRFPVVESFIVPEDFQERVEQQSIGATTRLLTQTDFPVQSYEPKVQVPFQVLPGQCPRKIEIERYAGELEREACPKEVASARLEGRGTADHEVLSPAAEPVEMFKQLSFNRNAWLSLLWNWEGSN